MQNRGKEHEKEPTVIRRKEDSLAIMRIILTGPPGSGKGTQSKRLGEKLQIPHISSGDVFRILVAQASSTSRELTSYMSNGLLVPDELD